MDSRNGRLQRIGTETVRCKSTLGERQTFDDLVPVFMSMKMVDWHYVLPMAVAAIIGGYGAAGVAKRVGRVVVRRFVIAGGLAMSVILFVRVF